MKIKALKPTVINGYRKTKELSLDEVKKKDFTHKDSKSEFISSRYEGTDSGYSESEIKICVGENGSISFSGDGDGQFIYLYPEQVKHLRKILRIK